MILIIAIFTIGLTLMAISVDAMINERRSYERAQKFSTTQSQFAKN